MPRVAEATPHRWHRKFSAVRSAVRMPRAGPLIVAIRSPGASRLPSGRSTATLIAGSISRNAAVAKSSPATTPACRATSAVSVRALGRDDRIGRQIAGAAEILEQRRAHRRFDHDRGQGRDCRHQRTASMRSTARRARSARAGSMVTSSCIVSSARRIFGKRDALHVRAEIARPHELDVGMVHRDVVGHRAFGHSTTRAGFCLPT